MRSYGATDVGQRREANEDAFLQDDEIGLWVVADGMGGHAAGEVASREAIDTIHGMVRRGKQSLELAGPFTEEKGRAAARMLEGAVQAATYLLYAMAELDRGMAGMGTTISAMMRSATGSCSARSATAASTAFAPTRPCSSPRTTRSSPGSFKQGLITEDQARTSRQRNVITRAVGSRDYVQVDTSTWDAEVGDAYLLCSDGLHGYLTLEEIPSILAEGGAFAVRASSIELGERARRQGQHHRAVVVESLA